MTPWLVSSRGTASHQVHPRSQRFDGQRAGAPQFVLHAAAAIKSSGKSVAEYVDALIGIGEPDRTAQERLLESAIDVLSPEEKRVASGLAVVELALDGTEWIEVLAPALNLASAAVRRAVGRLLDLGIAIRTEGGDLSLHDVFRALCVDRAITPTETQRIREVIGERIKSELLGRQGRQRIVAYLRILASLGRISDLADIGNQLTEYFRETGTTPEIRGHLQAALLTGKLSAEDEFWAHDSLAFFDLEEGKHGNAASRFTRMDTLADGLDDTARNAVRHKRLLVASKKGDIEQVRYLADGFKGSATHQRIVRYHLALAEGDHGQVDRAMEMLEGLADEYLEHLGLDRKDVFAKNPPEIREQMGESASSRDVIRLADCYFAFVQLARKHRKPAKIAMLYSWWAMKFFEIGAAHDSSLRSGQDAVDWALSEWDDPEFARGFLEKTLIPAANQVGRPEMIVSVRSQHAVVCAHCGDFVAADKAIELLEPYVAGSSPEARRELETQRKLVAQLKAKGPPPVEVLEARKRRIAGVLKRTEELKQLFATAPASIPARPLRPGATSRAIAAQPESTKPATGRTSGKSMGRRKADNPPNATQPSLIDPPRRSSPSITAPTLPRPRSPFPASADTSRPAGHLRIPKLLLAALLKSGHRLGTGFRLLLPRRSLGPLFAPLALLGPVLR